MDYMGNESYWDKKFSERGEKLLSAENMLVENIGYFKEGAVLDIACGDGRNTIFLLENDFKVTAVDFSEIALERLSKFCEQKGYSVITKKVDLSDDNALKDLGVFDNIVINHYRLSKEILDNIYKIINKDGILFVNGFGHKHKVDNRIRKEDLIYSNDFTGLKPWFDLIKYVQNEDETGFFSTFIFKRNDKK